jgi:hypothetical protein
MSFAGLSRTQPDSMQNLKNVRSRSNFFRAEIGAISHDSRYWRSSGSPNDLIGRLPNFSFSSSVSRLYLSRDAVESLRASQSLTNDSQAVRTEASSLPALPPSQSRTSFCAASQLRRSRDFLIHLPCRVPLYPDRTTALLVGSHPVRTALHMPTPEVQHP